jgi:hypothetical protein
LSIDSSPAGAHNRMIRKVRNSRNAVAAAGTESATGVVGCL